MAIQDLLKQHTNIGATIEAANKAMPFQAMTLAKKAASQSHELIGDIIDHVSDIEARLSKMEAAING